jgi:hypothetical protein
MKKFDFLMICLLFSFTSYSQTNEDLAKAETKKMISELKLTGSQYEDLYNANLSLLIQSNDLEKSKDSEDAKAATLLKLEEKRKLIYKDLLTTEQYLNYEKSIESASNPIIKNTPETAEDIASKETAILTTELKLNREQVSPVYTIILGLVEKNKGIQSSGLSSEEKELSLTRSQQVKTAMFKDILNQDQFIAYEKYLSDQAKIKAEQPITVPKEKKITTAEPAQIEEIKN